MSLFSGKLIDNQTHSGFLKLPKEMPLSLKSVCLVFLDVAADEGGVRSATCRRFTQEC